MTDPVLSRHSSTAHCTQHERYEPGCVWCYSAAVSLAAATRTFPEPSDPLLPVEYWPEGGSDET